MLLDHFDDFVTRYTHNLSTGGVFVQTEDPRPIAAVAEKFHLELALVCRANGHPADCGEIRLAPGEDTLVLPLGRAWPGAVTTETP